MSDIKAIDDNIYNIEGLVVEKHKKNPLLSIVILAIGVGIIATAYGVESIKHNANLSSALIFLGFAVALWGLFGTIRCFSGKGKPFHNGKLLRRYEFFNDQTQREKIRELVEKGDFQSLDQLPHSSATTILAVIYRTDDNEVAVAQTLEYVPHYYRPLNKIKTFKKGEFINSSKFK